MDFKIWYTYLSWSFQSFLLQHFFIILYIGGWSVLLLALYFFFQWTSGFRLSPISGNKQNNIPVLCNCHGVPYILSSFSPVQNTLKEKKKKKKKSLLSPSLSKFLTLRPAAAHSCPYDLQSKVIMAFLQSTKLFCGNFDISDFLLLQV